MTKIYLIRHGEAEGNLYRRSQGQYNANITALGKAQIAALAERFRDVSIDALWSSDLNRAMSTATALLKYHPELALHTTPRLREVCMGQWEDTPWGNIDRADHDQMEYFTYDPARWSIPGSESYGAVTERMLAVMLELAAENQGKTIAVVSHGFAIRSLLCRLEGAAFAELPYGDNTSVALLAEEGDVLRAEWYNDNSHLPPELSTFGRQAWWRGRNTSAEKEYFLHDPLDLDTEGDLYSRCYADTWMASHGNLAGYAPGVYRAAAERKAAADPQCVMKLSASGKFAGLVELDPEKGAEDGAGWISLLFVEHAMRDRRMGMQLMGHAVSYFRKKGRRSIRLHVARENERAMGFYLHNGFVKIGETPGVGGVLNLMELDITQRMFILE